MEKEQVIEEIKKIIAEVGGFYVGEIEAQGICVNEMGNFVAIAEGFFSEIEVNIYEPSSFSSDSIDDYTLTYEELEKDVLEEILLLCDKFRNKTYEEQQLEENE